jgi:serine/threonine protein kinase
MILSNKYKILTPINNGSYGKVFLGESMATKTRVAIKMEDKEVNLLKREAQIYQYLAGHPGIPRLKYYGTTKALNYLVLPFLGKSLSSRNFSREETLFIARKMVEIVEYVHSKSFLHRDLKPDNFLIGDGCEINVQLIDFGLAKKYIDEENKHISFKKGKHLVGSVNYSSVNVQKGYEASRRDDLESLLYIILFLLIGKLPWEGLRDKDTVDIKLGYSHEYLSNAK